MKRKILAVALGLVLVLGLAACGTPAASSSAAPGGSSTAGSSQPASTGGTGEVTSLVMAFPTWTGAPQELAVANEAINAYTREKLGVEVELQVYDIGSYKQSMTLALSSGERLDIINCIQLGYASMVSQGYLTNLNDNDLLGSYGGGIADAVGQKYLDACLIDGELYGLPNNRDMAVGRGCVAIVTECLDEIGYTAPADAGEIIQVTQEEVDDLLAQLHTAFPDMETYRPITTNNLAQYTTFDQLGGSIYGVLLDYGADLTVENMFTSDEYMQYCQMMYDWNQKGYISRDAATDTTAVATLIQAGTLVSYTTGGKPGSKVQESSIGVDMTIFQTKDNFVASSAATSFPWVIPINTVDAQAAMTLLNAFYTDGDLSTLLIYGIEGQHYEVMEDGTAQYIRDDGGTAPYATLGWMAPNQFISYVLYGNDPGLWEETKAFNDNAIQSAASGFTFDASGVETEIAAVQNVYDEYQKSVEFGFVDPETAIPEMNEKMLAAGLQKIIDEKQTQLDAWAAAR